MNRIIIDNKTGSVDMDELLILASRIDIKDKDFKNIMGVRFKSGVTCVVRRNKKSISMTFHQEEEIESRWSI